MTIQEIIKKDFNEANGEIVYEKVKNLESEPLNVGNEQLIRSILFLSKGDIDKFLSFFPIYDPRDLVMEAQNTKQCDGVYF